MLSTNTSSMRIHRAASDGDLASLNSLLALEKDGGLQLLLDAPDPEAGLTPLMWAVSSGQDVVVGRLLSLGADTAAQEATFGSSAVHIACLQGHASTLALLVDAGAPLNLRTHVGSTPLMIAASDGDAACVKVLLDRGGARLETNAQTHVMGATALHCAVAFDRPEVVQLLLAAGADPAIQDHGGFTALQRAKQEMCTACAALLSDATATAAAGAKATTKMPFNAPPNTTFSFSFFGPVLAPAPISLLRLHAHAVPMPRVPIAPNAAMGGTDPHPTIMHLGTAVAAAAPVLVRATHSTEPRPLTAVNDAVAACMNFALGVDGLGWSA